jgi:hypothetical protein
MVSNSNQGQLQSSSDAVRRSSDTYSIQTCWQIHARYLSSSVFCSRCVPSSSSISTRWKQFSGIRSSNIITIHEPSILQSSNWPIGPAIRTAQSLRRRCAAYRIAYRPKARHGNRIFPTRLMDIVAYFLDDLYLKERLAL